MNIITLTRIAYTGIIALLIGSLAGLSAIAQIEHTSQVVLIDYRKTSSYQTAPQIQLDADGIIYLTNEEREKAGLNRLTKSERLTAAAQKKAQHMCDNDYWAHVAPDGTEPWSFISAEGYSIYTAGENLAKGFHTTAGVIAGWMNSEGHRANVLNDSFKETGIYSVECTIDGMTSTLIVAMYGTQL